MMPKTNDHGMYMGVWFNVFFAIFAASKFCIIYSKKTNYK